MSRKMPKVAKSTVLI